MDTNNESNHLTAPGEMLQLSSPGQTILGWVTLVFWSLLLILLIMQEGLTSDGLFPLITFTFLFVSSLALILSSPRCKINRHIIVRESLLGRYQIGWDEVEKIQTDSAKMWLIFCSDAQGIQKRLLIPNSRGWRKKAPAFSALLNQQISERRIPIEIVLSVGLGRMKNTKVPKDAPEPETYISKPPKFAPVEVAPMPVKVQPPAPVPAPKSTVHILLSMGAGFGAAIVGAALWAGVSYATNYQIGYMAIAIGFLVGYAMRWTAGGTNALVGFIGAGLSLFGCLLGNLFLIVAFGAREVSVPFFFLLIEVLFRPDVIIEAMSAAFSPIDLLFYGLATYYGYRIASAGR